MFSAIAGPSLPSALGSMVTELPSPLAAPSKDVGEKVPDVVGAYVP